MQFIIDTEKKEITLLHDIKLGDLVNLLSGLCQEEADNYTIKHAKQTFLPKVDPVPYIPPFNPYDPLNKPFYQSPFVGTTGTVEITNHTVKNITDEFINPSLPIGNVYSNADMTNYWDPVN
jgi:hypothetical protein